VVNLFVWPKRGAQVNTTTRRGYTIVGWQQGDLRFCVVSDLAQGELERIAQLVRN
jgi:anti-sigma factor RsiW